MRDAPAAPSLSPLTSSAPGSWTILQQAATELGHRCQEGIPLQAIPADSWWIEDGQLHVPHPGSADRCAAPPDRHDLENALAIYLEHPVVRSCSTRQRLKALHLLARPLGINAHDLAQWRRVFVQRETLHLKKTLRLTYAAHLQADDAVSTDGQVRGIWQGESGAGIDRLLPEILRSYANPDDLIKRGRRSTLWLGSLFATPVIIKRYEPNPRPWRRPFEICRARRAWAGVNTLNRAELPVPDPLGWLEVLSGPEAGTSYFITRPLPTSETVRTWLRREWKKMSPNEHTRFRHLLREHFSALYSKGLVHLDAKLSNLRIAQNPEGGLGFIWTDLEDIRPQRILSRTFLRNLYQINGSLPREIPAEHRHRFLKGFRTLFPRAASPWVARYIRRVTLKRHRRELRRQCGA